MKLVVLLAAALLSAAVQAQDYPSRPLRFVVPYPPGALTDVLARAIGDRARRPAATIEIDERQTQFVTR